MLRLRAFAGTDLHLPADAIFTSYADLGRPYAVWVVYASPEFSLEGKGWWYPLVGTLKYRGFFDRTSAKAEADKLKAQGYDVLMSGVEAYSTLGWFSDPVLNTFIGRGEGDLAELIFHELTHARLFLPGDTDFNEALATAVGEEGTRRWFTSQHQPDKLKAYEQELAKDEEIIRLLLRTREELKQLYKTSLPPAMMRRDKTRVLATLQTVTRNSGGAGKGTPATTSTSPNRSTTPGSTPSPPTTTLSLPSPGRSGIITTILRPSSRRWNPSSTAAKPSAMPPWGPPRPPPVLDPSRREN